MSMKNARKGQAATQKSAISCSTLHGQAAIERTSFASCSQSKGQAAMEYLMTYGWAILVIVIVLAVLLFLNPFKAPETCLFQQPGFSCSEALPQVYTTDGGQTVKMAMVLSNKLGQTVTIHKIVCTTASIGDVANSFDGLQPSDTISAGASKKYTVDCVGPSGTGSLSMGENSQFKGVISVWYNYENDPDPNINRQASATLITNVLKGSTAP